MVSAGMPVPETKTPYQFSSLEKHYRKKDAIHKGQDGRVWRLFSMSEGNVQPSPYQQLA
jgi:hypothetical protein